MELLYLLSLRLFQEDAKRQEQICKRPPKHNKSISHEAICSSFLTIYFRKCQVRNQSVKQQSL